MIYCVSLVVVMDSDISDKALLLCASLGLFLQEVGI